MAGRILGAVVLMGALLSSGSVLADNITTQSKITSVTVFPRGAQITRETEISLKPGEHTITLSDLPIGAIRDSIRVEGTSDGNLEIGSVDVKTIYVNQNNDTALNTDERKSLEEAIKKLQDDKLLLLGKLPAIQAQKNFIQNLVHNSTRIEKGKSLLESQSPEKMVLLIGAQMRQLEEEKIKVNFQIRDINKKIKELTQRLHTKPVNQDQRTQVKISLTAENGLKAKLKVRYQINRAGWRPLYDARLDTLKGPENASLTLTRRASISQTSGEEWNDVELYLSTTKPNRRTAPPGLRSLLVALRPKERPKLSYGGRAANEDRDEPKKSRRRYLAKERAAPAAIQFASVKQSAFQAVFKIRGTSSIASTGEMKKVTISKVSLQPQLKAIAIPRLQKVAYLSAKFKLPKDALVLAGRVNLHRDGVYIGRGYLPDLTAGAEHELGFGTDEAIQVKFAQVDRSKGSSGIISSSKTDMRKFKISVKNLHNWTIPLTIMDRIPFTEDENIKVKMLSSTTTPSRKNVDDKRGLLAWDFKLKKGEGKDISLAYQINWPTDKQIVYRNR